MKNKSTSEINWTILLCNAIKIVRKNVENMDKLTAVLSNKDNNGGMKFFESDTV